MARLVSPATKRTFFDKPVARIPVSRIPRPVPIQSASSTTSSTAAAAARRHVPTQSASSRIPLNARMALRQLLAREVLASSRTNSTMPVISRSQLATTSRTNSAVPRVSQTRIPGPTTTAIQNARSKILIRMPTMIVRPPTHIMNAMPRSSVLPLNTIQNTLEEEVGSSHREAGIVYEDASEAYDSSLCEDENTSLLFNDYSFDDSIDPNRQTPGLNLLERTLIVCKRVGDERKIARCPWFIGLARCPAYIGDTIQQARVRPPKKALPRMIQPKQRHSYYTAPIAPATSKLPYLVWPLAKPAVPPVISTTPSGTALAKPASDSKTTSPTKEHVGKKSERKATSTCKPMPHHNNDSSESCNRDRPSSTRQKVLVKPPVSKSQLALPLPSQPSKSHSGVPTLKSCRRQTGIKRQVKHIRFAEGPQEPCFFDREAPANDSPLRLSDEWSPLKVCNTYAGSSQAKGMTMFEPSCLGALTLKYRPLLRYESVQEYERRRKEESLAKDERPELGQLDYGNTDYKIALQATDVITLHDIGTFQDPGAIGKSGIPMSSYHPVSGPLLVFGAFKEPFMDAIVPTQTAQAYKKSLRWPAPGSEKRWKKFENEQLRCLQQANLGN
ncbi:Nn.00g084410.m01.CDS01 [Neocucurbitaria sp. VM-36]